MSNKRWTNWQRPKIKDGIPTKWGWVVKHPDNFSLGKNTDIGFGTYINAKYGVVIDQDVQIGSHGAIYSVNTIDGTKGPIHLKKNCKIGSHTIIMPGVVIGENSVVGAFSLVKNDVPDNVTVYGNPVV